MGLVPILSVIHTVTIGTMLNCGGGNNGGGIKNVTCRQTFRPFSHIPTLTPIPFGLCDTIHKFHIASTLTLRVEVGLCKKLAQYSVLPEMNSWFIAITTA